MDNTNIDRGGLKLIPKYMDFYRYMIIVLEKLPRVEKFSMGTDFKRLMNKTIENIMYIGKISENERLGYVNKIDALIATQRELLRVMKDYNFVAIKSFDVAIGKISEVGKMVGGLIKIYGKYSKE